MATGALAVTVRLRDEPLFRALVRVAAAARAIPDPSADLVAALACVDRELGAIDERVARGGG